MGLGQESSLLLSLHSNQCCSAAEWLSSLRMTFTISFSSFPASYRWLLAIMVSLVIFTTCVGLSSEHQIYIANHKVLVERPTHEFKEMNKFHEKIIVSKGLPQGDTLKVLWAMATFYVFHGDHFEEQSSIGCINPVLGPVVMFCFWVSLITFQSHLVCVSDVVASRLDKGLPVYSPVCPGQCTGVSWTNIRLGNGSFSG